MPAKAIGLPEDRVPHLVDSTWAHEFASRKRGGRPITTSLTPFSGDDGRTIDVNTGLAHPWKTERARNNLQVCLLYSEPKGSLIENPPVILVYGHTPVYDSDLPAPL
jgi:hypothetical protein